MGCRLPCPVMLVLSCRARPMLGALIRLPRVDGRATACCWFGAAVGSGCWELGDEPFCFHQTVDPRSATTSSPVALQETTLKRWFSKNLRGLLMSIYVGRPSGSYASSVNVSRNDWLFLARSRRLM